MPDLEIDKCASCSAPVIWATTERLRSMPVDAEPSKDGNVQLVDRNAGPPLARVLKVAEQFGKTNLRTSHLATCPQAAKWRKDGRRAG